jgi:hypothetical protein
MLLGGTLIRGGSGVPGGIAVVGEPLLGDGSSSDASLISLGSLRRFRGSAHYHGEGDGRAAENQSPDRDENADDRSGRYSTLFT